MILPGYDDPKKYRRELFPVPGDITSALNPERQSQLLTKLDRRIDFLLRKAICQAGFSTELAQHAELDWSGSGFWPGTDLASQYATPAILRRFRRLHVRITWRDAAGRPMPIAGPICLGGGRFVGIGVFAALP
jgi:CRISPR-associated protein Csb2